MENSREDVEKVFRKWLFVAVGRTYYYKGIRLRLLEVVRGGDSRNVMVSEGDKQVGWRFYEQHTQWVVGWK